MKRVLLAIGFMLLIGGSLISCKRDCYCNAYRLETGNHIDNLNVGPATKQSCKKLNGVREIQIYTETFHDSIVCTVGK